MKLRRARWQIYVTHLPEGTKVILPELTFRTHWDALRFCNAINLPLRDAGHGRINMVFNYEQIP